VLYCGSVSLQRLSLFLSCVLMRTLMLHAWVECSTSVRQQPRGCHWHNCNWHGEPGGGGAAWGDGD
jgi:hypothetical protein